MSDTKMTAQDSRRTHHRWRIGGSVLAAASLVFAAGVATAQPAPNAQPAAKPAPKPDKPAPDGAGEASDEPAQPTRSSVLHLPPISSEAEQELRIVAVVDAAWTEAALVVRYRRARSGADWAEAPFERSSAGGYFATIPADSIGRPGVEYYIAGQLTSGEETPHFASADAPHLVIIAPTQAERWAALELERLGGRDSEVSFDAWGQDFGNRFENRDQYLRGELDFTHRLLFAKLYSISLGYGFIQGRTPNDGTINARADAQGARYGYGGLRLRLHPSVWVDGEAAMGVANSGFIVGGRGVITLGKPWRSSVNLGIEGFQELGPSFWVRLQWDTVPPFLMGATIMKTDLPAAFLEGGAYLAYDISFPIAKRVTLRGSLSFGSRDGPGRFGGGLGTSFAF